MINEVRNTVLSIISKDNRGYITPLEFNLFARQAQLEIFEQYMYNYSNAMAKQNARIHGEGYSNIVQNNAEVIDNFSVFASLSMVFPGQFYIPGNYYFIEKLLYNNNKEIERVEHQKLTNLLNSNMTAPTVNYPAYTLTEGYGNTQYVNIYPTSITSNVQIRYIRFPKIPMWTYATTPNGEAFFDPSSPSYQDFELPESDLPNLVIKILEYAGISIRDNYVVSAAKADEIQDAQQKQ